MKAFDFVGVVAEGQPIDVLGLNPWQHEWRRLPLEPVELPHPSYPAQLHKLWLYEIEDAGRTITFAAGELSANVWGFYLPAA